MGIAPALALLLLAAPARAGIADDIKSRLTPFTVLRGEFAQVKTIKIIRKPLRSSGDFVLAKGRGVLWRTARPMASTMKVTASEIAQIKDGKTVFRLRADEQPALKLITRVLFAVFAADVAELERGFAMTGETGGENWKAELRPRDPMVAKVVPEIRISGAKLLEEIDIREAIGDRTLIRFSAVKTDTALSPAEGALFD